ncbi:MAG: hypothetical protein ACRC76_00265 [Proteocatella sp.]
MYNKNHNVVQSGQKCGAYFTFTVNGPRETIKPRPKPGEQGITQQGYGLRVDEQKKGDIKSSKRVHKSRSLRKRSMKK